MENIKREEFVEAYLKWLGSRLRKIMPEEDTKYRMAEIARRQSLYNIEYLVKSMDGKDNPAEIAHLRRKFLNKKKEA